MKEGEGFELKQNLVLDCAALAVSTTPTLGMNDRQTDGAQLIERTALSTNVEHWVFGAKSTCVSPGMDAQGPHSWFCSGEMFSE